MTHLKRTVGAVVTVFLFFISTATLAFTIRSIQITGNQRLSDLAVLRYVPLHVGQDFQHQDSDQLLAHLYHTGLFSNVSLSRRHQTLVIRVVERPIIRKITLTGNKKISDDKLKPVLKHFEIETGKPFNPSVVNQFKAMLMDAYRNMGRFDVSVALSVVNTPYNTVELGLRVTEGAVTKVHQISFEGNTAFSSRTLRNQLTLTTPGLFTLFNSHDLFSERQLGLDLDALRQFYLNRGYLDFVIRSHQVKMLNNKTQADINISVFEGKPYKLAEIILPQSISAVDSLSKRIQSVLKPGQLFVRNDVLKVNQSIHNYYADHGYALVQVNVVPVLHRSSQTVDLRYSVVPGKRYVVRYAHLAGNYSTTGRAVRYQMRQLEGSVYSKHNIDESKRRIANLPFFSNIQVTPVPVSSAPNQMDLMYHVTEVNAGRAQIQGGYSTSSGFLYGVSVSDPNFLGTGKLAAINFQHSQSDQQYSITYDNPFYTPSGISRGVSAFYTHATPSKLDRGAYAMDSYGASLSYSIPLTEYADYSLGMGYVHQAVGHIDTTQISPEVAHFLKKHPSPYNNVLLNTGLSISTLDRAVFPHSGYQQSLSLKVSLPALKSSLPYYTAEYTARWYYPLTKGSAFILHPHVDIGYGMGYGKVDVLPFFQNYYAGGLDSLPGYDEGSLGPRNPAKSTESLGGNLQALGGVNLIFPCGLGDSVRTSLFFDFGNVFQTKKSSGGFPLSKIKADAVSFGNLRYSAGVMLTWRSPLGMIGIGYAIPFHTKPGDKLDQFGFSFGTMI